MSEDCEEVICLEGDPTGNYKKYAKKRFQNMKELYSHQNVIDSEDGEYDEFSLTADTDEAEKDDFYGECPNTRESLGFFTWNYLHTMSMHYPKVPTVQEKTDMTQFMHTFAHFYPCKRKSNSRKFRSHFHSQKGI